MHWLTISELLMAEELYRRAEIADAGELGELDQHRAAAIYSTANARMLDAPPEVRADPAMRDAHVRAIEDRGKPRWYP